MDILIVWGLPTAITSFFFWWLKRRIDKTEAKREKREQTTEQLILLLIQNSRATSILAEATAKAVQRIPDAKCNGDMHAALEAAAVIQKKEKDFILDQGIQNIFEN